MAYRSIVSYGFVAGVLLTTCGRADAAPVTVYISRNPSVYHTAECKRLRFGQPIALSEAAARYAPCPVCKPQQPLLASDVPSTPSPAPVPVAASDANQPSDAKAAGMTAPVSGVVNREVERAVATAKTPPPLRDSRARDEPNKPRPFVRNGLIGAAVGGLIGGFLGSQIDLNEGDEVGPYTAVYGLYGAGVGGAVGAITAFIR